MSLLDLDQVETPIGLVDLARVRRNAKRVAEYAAAHGLRWRPHIKTHKSLRIARIQLEAGARGLTVATLREAEVMATVADDLLLAYPPVGDAKLDRLTALPDAVDLKIALDSEEVLRGVSVAMAKADRKVGVLVELDVGLGRVGLQRAEDVVRLARLADQLPGVSYRGVLFYPGQIRIPPEAQSPQLSAVDARVRETLRALSAANLEPEIVSGGSTPTLWRSHEVHGMTEIRSGSCIYFDREALDIGVAEEEDVAYTVLATVVSTAVPGHAVVDAGSKALSKEARGEGRGFGVVAGRPGVLVSGLSEEHGVLDLGESGWRPEIGDRVRIVPNHVCVSVNLQDAPVAMDDERHSLLPLEARGRGPWTA